MSTTCSQLNVRILPQAYIAHGPAGTNQKCADLPPAAHTIRNGWKPALPPMETGFAAHDTFFFFPLRRRHPARYPVTRSVQQSLICVLPALRTTYFARLYDKNGHEMPTFVSCYESPCHYPVTRSKKNFSKLDQSGQNMHFDTLSIPCRYPISQEFAATLRHTWTFLGLFWTESAAFWHTCAALPTRRLTPPLTSNPLSARAGEVALDEALHSPKRPDASILATDESVAEHSRSATDESSRRVLVP